MPRPPVDCDTMIPGGLKCVLDQKSKIKFSDLTTERVEAAAWIFQKSDELWPQTVEIIRNAPVTVRKILCRREFTLHVALLDFLAKYVKHEDSIYPSLLGKGLPTVGELGPTGLWTPLSEEEKYKGKISLTDLEERCDEAIASTKAMEGPGKHDEELWKATVKDINNDFAEGPFDSAEQVALQPRSTFIEDDNGNQILEMLTKCRAVDNQAANLTNLAVIISGRMRCSSPDEIAAHARYAAELWQNVKLGAAAVDMKSAYRVIPQHPEHLKFTVPSVWNPEKGCQQFIVVLGHVLGSVGAVHNFCRISELLRAIAWGGLHLPANFFFDDHWILEPLDSLPEAMGLLKWLFTCSGLEMEVSKNQEPSAVTTLLGVSYDFTGVIPKMCITAEKKARWIARVSEVLKEGKPTSAAAGKLRGAFQFCLSYLYGSSAKCELYQLVRRQCHMGRGGSVNFLNKDLTESLKRIATTIYEAVPRDLPPRAPPHSHAVCYTDGCQEHPTDLSTWGIGGCIILAQSFHR